MSRPTAASSSKTHKAEKADVKSPPRPSKQIPHRPKINGHPKGVETVSKGAVAEPVGDTTAIDESEILPEEVSPNFPRFLYKPRDIADTFCPIRQ